MEEANKNLIGLVNLMLKAGDFGGHRELVANQVLSASERLSSANQVEEAQKLRSTLFNSLTRERAKEALNIDYAVDSILEMASYSRPENKRDVSHLLSSFAAHLIVAGATENAERLQKESASVY